MSAIVLDFNAQFVARHAVSADDVDRAKKARAREEARLAAVAARHFTGAKFDATRDIKDIAKLIRADIAAAIKANVLPAGFTVSVKVDRYSMGESVNVKITACRGMLVNPRRVEADLADPHGRCVLPLRTARAEQIIATVQSIVDAYNYDKSDTAADYHNQRFHSSVGFALEMLEAQRAEILTAIRLSRTA